MNVVLQYIIGLCEGTLSGSNDAKPNAVAAPNDKKKFNTTRSVASLKFFLPTTAAAGR
jgi:hypothetical protein